MRKALIVGNWKMNKTNTETENFLGDLLLLDLDPAVEVLVCPPSINLYLASTILKNSAIKLGGQNMHYEAEGAFTGETSPLMLKDIGVDYVILGHSERREIFGESDELIKEKVKAAFDNAICPILCVGESLDQRENGIYKEVIKEQISKGIEGLSQDQVESLVIAYEPIWAIGTGKTASVEDASEMAKYIRALIKETYGQAGDKMRILYGGSVKPENIKDFMTEDDIDGALVGGASLKADSFEALVNYGR